MTAIFSEERKKIDFHGIPKCAISPTDEGNLEHPSFRRLSQAHQNPERGPWKSWLIRLPRRERKGLSPDSFYLLPVQPEKPKSALIHTQPRSPSCIPWLSFCSAISLHHPSSPPCCI